MPDSADFSKVAAVAASAALSGAAPQFATEAKQAPALCAFWTSPHPCITAGLDMHAVAPNSVASEAAAATRPKDVAGELCNLTLTID